MIYLRPMTEEDTADIVVWRNSPDVRKSFIYQEDFTPEGHLRWLHEVVQTGRAAQMMICEEGSGRALGSVYIRDIDHIHHKGEYGIFLGTEAARGRGIGTEAARLMIAYGFETLGLHRIYLRALSENARAIRSYEKAGFIKEGCLKDDVRIHGEYKDIVWMAIVRNNTDEN